MLTKQESEVYVKNRHWTLTFPTCPHVSTGAWLAYRWGRFGLRGVAESVVLELF
jgi:hypothetical protein